MEPVYRTVVGLCLATFRAMDWDLQVHGTQHVPRTGGAIIATNHVGYLDFIFVGAGVLQATEGRRLVRFAAKQETFDHPVSGPLLRAMRHIPVDRGGRATEAIDHAVRLLEQGELVGMFPESTISRSFVPLPGKRGTVLMAQRAGVPIVPGAVWGGQRLYTKGRPRDLTRRGVPITIEFGAPVRVDADEDPQAATGRLMASIGAMVDRAQRDYPVRPADGEDPWWLPAHLGGTAPTPDEAESLARQEAEARRSRNR